LGYVKYREDDNDAIDDREHYRKDYTVYSNPPMPNFDCPYCENVFNQREALNIHIKNEHNIARPSLVVNGKIAEKENYVTEIKSVKVDFYGLSSSVYFNGIEIPCSNTNIEIDLSQQAIEAIETKTSFTVTIDDFEIKVHKFSSNNIKNKNIDDIITMWNDHVAKGQYVSKAYPRKLNPAEKRYLDGFYNYFVACIANGANKQKRYEDAFAILSGFSPITSIARCVLQVISFRMNWVRKLQIYCASTRDFRYVCDFFANDYERKENLTQEDSSNIIFVEDDTKDCLEAILAELLGKECDVKKYLSRFNEEQLLRIEDVNQKNRILLLFARRERRKKNYRVARRYYEDIKFKTRTNDVPNYCTQHDFLRN
jgi:hypothetical protein